jgi:hypothetical protein
MPVRRVVVVLGILGLVASFGFLFVPYTASGTGERSFALRNVMQGCTDSHIEVEPADPAAYYGALDRCRREAWWRAGIGGGGIAVSAVLLVVTNRPQLSRRVRHRQPAWP